MPVRRRTIKSMNRGSCERINKMTWTLLSIFGIAPLGALAFDRPTFGNWIWHIDPDKPKDHE
jgi:hypothetical protein